MNTELKNVFIPSDDDRTALEALDIYYLGEAHEWAVLTNTGSTSYFVAAVTRDALEGAVEWLQDSEILDRVSGRKVWELFWEMLRKESPVLPARELVPGQWVVVPAHSKGWADYMAWWRERRYLTQGEAAGLLGISRRTLVYWEAGEMSPIMPQAVALAIRALEEGITG